MAYLIIIPIILVAILGLSGYLVYKFVVYDMSCKRSVTRMLREYKIPKSPSQIIREYYALKGETLHDKDVMELERNYRQKEPEQFLEMYDAVRENYKQKDGE